MKRAPAFTAACLLALAMPAAAQTIGELQLKATAGDRDAQFVMGEAYRTGQGVTPDRDQAIAWFRKAATLGDARAADALGLLLFTKGERRESIPLLETAARREDARALYLLATARFNGDGVAKDIPRSYAQMRAAANKGLPQAIRSLQLMEPYITDQDRLAADRIASGAMPYALAPATMPATASTNAAAAPVPARPAPAAPAPVRTVELPPSVPAANAVSALPAPVPQTTYAPPVPRPAPASVQAAPSPPVAPPPRRAPPAPVGRWRVQLGALVTQDKAEEQWRALLRKVPQLAGRSHVIMQAGPIWRLQVTGLASHADAQGLCGSVVARGGACIALAPSP